MSEPPDSTSIELTAEIVSAYVAKNSLPATEPPTLSKSVHEALIRLSADGVAEEAKPAEELKPAAPIGESITVDYLRSLENGQRFKSLKRHLMTSYDMTPQQYRERWGLPKDHPMVAPTYAASRSALAKSLGLGCKAAPAPIPVAAAESMKKAGRPRKAAAELA